MKNKLSYISLVSLLVVSGVTGCGSDSGGNKNSESASQAKAFNALSEDARFVTKSIQAKNGIVYTQAGRLVRFEIKGHTLKLKDTAGVINGFIREDNGTLLYIPTTEYVKATDALVYTDNGDVKTVDIQINSDPLYSEQWHLHNTGQTSFTDLNIPADGETDLNMQNALASGYLGEGVTVAVVDYGMDIKQPDLIANINYGSMDLIFAVRDSNSVKSSHSHGTEVAGIIAASGWNLIGGRGVAPDAKLISYNYLDSDAYMGFLRSHGFSNATAFFALPNSIAEANVILTPLAVDDLARVYNESWGDLGVLANRTNFHSLDLFRNSIVKKGILEGFNNKGNIYVKSAANNEAWYTANQSLHQTIYPIDLPNDYFLPTFNEMDAITKSNHGLPFAGAMLGGYKNSPYVIVVAAVTAQGKQATYSGSGSNVFISGLGGERPAGRIITTDFSGCTEGTSNWNAFGSGVDAFNIGQLDVNTHCDYVASMDGTSAAAPTVSGAIADILSANPDLTWRDVRYILAKTAKKVDSDSPEVYLTVGGKSLLAQNGWFTNKAGYHFNNRYGFGLVDIDGAIKLALSYKANSQGKYKEYPIMQANSFKFSIPDNDADGKKATLPQDKDAVIETVQLHVEIAHDRVNDLQIELTSPSGTTAIVLNPYAGFDVTTSNSGLNLTFNINSFFGESMKGDWSLRVIDVNSDKYEQKHSFSEKLDKNTIKLAAIKSKLNNPVEGTLKSVSIQINGHDK